MSSKAVPESLKLVLEHLDATRELHRYLDKQGDVWKDLAYYAKEVLKPAIEESVPPLRDWKFDCDGSLMHWYPKAWEIDGDGLHLSLCVFVPSPVDDADFAPSVNIFVPSDWDGHENFCDRSKCLKPLLGKEGGFKHISTGDDLDEETPIAKYVSWLNADGQFDEDDLLRRIAQEAEKIVASEPEITQVVKETLETFKGSKGGRKKSRGKR